MNKDEVIICNFEKINPPSSIVFQDGDGNWVMKLEKGNILFNRENWPTASPDDFALSVIEILERSCVNMYNWRKTE